MEQIGVVAWLVVSPVFCNDPLSGQYTANIYYQTALTQDIYVD